MKNIYCKCGRVVGMANDCLSIRKGTIHLCRECQPTKTKTPDVPDFFKSVFGVRK